MVRDKVRHALLVVCQTAPAPGPLLAMSRDELLDWALKYADWWKDIRGIALRIGEEV